MSSCDPGCPPAHPGPAGPRGPAGAQGPPGPAGPTGDAITIESDGVVVGTTSVLNFIGFTVTQDGDGTINVSGGGTAENCWTCSAPDTVVRLTDVGDTVAIGAAAMVGTEKVRIVGDERLEGIFIHTTAGGAAVAGAGDFRVFSGWDLQGRNSLNTANRNILDWGQLAADQLQVGDVANSVTRIQGSDIRIGFGAGGTLDRVQFIGSVMNFQANVGEVDYDITHFGQALFGLDAAAGVRNLAIFANAATNFQSGNRIIFLINATAAPTGNPTGGGYLYATGGAGTWRGSAGTITTFGPA